MVGGMLSRGETASKHGCVAALGGAIGQPVSADRRIAEPPNNAIMLAEPLPI